MLKLLQQIKINYRGDKVVRTDADENVSASSKSEMNQNN